MYDVYTTARSGLVVAANMRKEGEGHPAPYANYDSSIIIYHQPCSLLRRILTYTEYFVYYICMI